MINLQEQVAGWYKIEAVKADGSRRVAADWFPNLITDGGLDRIANNTDSMVFCQVGSGSSSPLVTDTALASRVASKQFNPVSGDFSSSGAQGSAPYYGWLRLTYRFPQGAAAGNLSEVGVGWASSGGLFSRALILDSSGNPTTITVLSDEFLDVTYEFRRYPGVSDISGTVILDGVSYGWVSRASRVTAVDAWGMQNAQFGGSMSSASASLRTGAISTITGEPSGSSGSPTVTAKTYSIGSREAEFILSAGINTANFAIASLLLSGGGGVFAYQFGFTPAIPKDNTKILTLEVKHSWARKTL